MLRFPPRFWLRIPSVLSALLGWLTARPLRRGRRTGQGLVEYALILVLIAIVVIGALSTMGEQVSSTFEETRCTLASGKQHQDHGKGKSDGCKLK
jgi:pilus assembly protein Flp/PilA